MEFKTRLKSYGIDLTGSVGELLDAGCPGAALRDRFLLLPTQNTQAREQNYKLFRQSQNFYCFPVTAQEPLLLNGAVNRCLINAESLYVTADHAGRVVTTALAAQDNFLTVSIGPDIKCLTLRVGDEHKTRLPGPRSEEKNP